MLPFLVLIPVGASLVLGLVFVFHGDGQPVSKIAVSAVFLLALYLQFFTRHALAGLLLQVVLAVGLVLWRRVDAI